MASKYPATRKLLDGGGEVFINKSGKHWSVDMWDADAEWSMEPTYHAWYDNEDDARADFDSWKAWPKLDCPDCQPGKPCKQFPLCIIES
jgi:hypothetical protein